MLRGGECRNGRKRSGADRCARARFACGCAVASGPTLCGSSGGGAPAGAVFDARSGSGLGQPLDCAAPVKLLLAALRSSLTGAFGRRLFKAETSLAHDEVRTGRVPRFAPAEGAWGAECEH